MILNMWAQILLYVFAKYKTAFLNLQINRVHMGLWLRQAINFWFSRHWCRSYDAVFYSLIHSISGEHRAPNYRNPIAAFPFLFSIPNLFSLFFFLFSIIFYFIFGFAHSLLLIINLVFSGKVTLNIIFEVRLTLQVHFLNSKRSNKFSTTFKISRIYVSSFWNRAHHETWFEQRKV